jgi:hypothetical protein
MSKKYPPIYTISNSTEPSFLSNIINSYISNKTIKISHCNSLCISAALINSYCPSTTLSALLLQKFNIFSNSFKMSPYSKKFLSHALSHPNCPTHILDRILLSSKSDELKHYAVSNPSCNPSTLHNFTVNNWTENIKFVFSIVGNPACTSKTLSWIFHHPAYNSEILREQQLVFQTILDIIPCHPNCSPSLLKYIVNNKNSTQVTISHALRHPNCPIPCLEKCFTSIVNQHHIVLNPNCPPHLLYQFIKSRLPNCSLSLKSLLQLLNTIDSDNVLRWALNHHNTSLFIESQDNNNSLTNKISDDIQSLRRSITNPISSINLLEN